jgi:hypothetical protein
MNVQLHIGRLVIDGLPIEADSGRDVQAAVEAELRRRLTEHGLATGLSQGGAFAYVRGGSVDLQSTPDSDDLGTQIGAAVHEGLVRR